MMRDVQNQKDLRGIKITEVGIKNIKLPVKVLDKGSKKQNTVAEFDIVVSLAKDKKGTHMSRFIEILNYYVKKNLSMNMLSKMVLLIKKTLDAKEAKVIMRFPYFIEKKSPKSKKNAFLNYECCFICKGKKPEDKIYEVNVPITSLCPCSKEISKFGAHNQRGFVRIKLVARENIWIEDIIKKVEKEASCEIFSLLKRVDEKYVTEKAYENPKFVEDIVRDIVISLNKGRSIIRYEVGVLSNESVHIHDAYAVIKGNL